ncbi:hypothetical protein BU23DRAFT_35090 [Bimuria novae-zelandiae CBS 107.79]|uniref:Uncharacterized protein n=1 Tax=Bimuria novae-zelandiae CBS 107.79 TaxID=1447943 RepID=A0A6A5UKE7_9PLEO|nr:hypothetical protein BU23DRAFT_35090 [Bimuria novae-zelandiae CBS 107.79]
MVNMQECIYSYKVRSVRYTEYIIGSVSYLALLRICSIIARPSSFRVIVHLARDSGAALTVGGSMESPSPSRRHHL